MKKKIYVGILLIIYSLCLIDIIVFKGHIPPIKGLYSSINLIPFYGDSINPLEIILNILIFIPVGIYLELVNNKRDKQNILISIIFIVLLELEEYLLGTGILDITDIFTNTLGIYIGIILLRKIKQIFKSKIIDIIILSVATICTILLLIYLYYLNVHGICIGWCLY